MKSLKDKAITDFFTPIIFGSGKLFTYQKNIFKLQHNFNYITEATQAVGVLLVAHLLAAPALSAQAPPPNQQTRPGR